MATHPTLTATCAAGILAALVIPFTIQAGEAPAPLATASSAPAQTMQPYHEATAAFRLALDLETLRPQLLKAKPFSLLADPRMAEDVAAWSEGVVPKSRGKTQVARSDGTTVPLTWRVIPDPGGGLRVLDLTRTLVTEVRSLSVAMHDASRAGLEGFMRIRGDCGPGFDRLVQAVTRGKKAKDELPTGNYSRVIVFEGSEFSVRRDGSAFTILNRKGDFQERIIAAPAPPPVAAWFRYDAGPIFARHVRDPALFELVLGADWRKMKPAIEGQVAVVGAEVTGMVRVTGAAPITPMVGFTLPLLAGSKGNLPFATWGTWPMRRPLIAIPTSADRVASLSIGLTPPPPAQPFTKAVTTWKQNDGSLPLDLVLRMLVAAWSGDLALEIRPGAPLPRAALVLGLRPGTDAVEAVRQIAVWLELPQGSLDQPGSQPKGVAGLTPAGQVAITAYPDRLVATLNADSAEWPGIASAGPAADASGCAALVDLAAAARTWGPMYLALIPAEQRQSLPLPVLIDHLPVWSMRWDATPDGCRIEERGLPLAVVLTAAAAIRTVSGADPDREIGRGAAPPVQPQADQVSSPATF